ncbi:hypothetical protein [Campylobacter sp. JMF_03 NE3]|uniref:hypothetical protein n=1 Tax=Campylobacter sp. JMF_03 NE3 TaxID=2983831 RepID=UPI0022E9C64C|nr:hypothetical protein [Campylobacter sp. JMF_03 NE3]MDA3053550.1 hypothetical protein [Campylobacter sp. JMF_03 NE3]
MSEIFTIITIVWSCALGWLIAKLQIDINRLKRENELFKLKIEKQELMVEKLQLMVKEC